MVIFTKIPMWIVSLLCLFTMTRCWPGPPVYYYCNNEQITNPYYRSGVYYVVLKVAEETPKRGFNYYVESPGLGTAYGHGVCNGALPVVHCGVCLGAASSALRDYCPDRIGAQMQFKDCRVRYEAYQFNE